MTVSETSPAPPDGTGQQHRFVAIGFGFGGLIVAKALKHGQLTAPTPWCFWYALLHRAHRVLPIKRRSGFS